MEERMDMCGRLAILLHDRGGRLVLEQRRPNRIVTSGRRLVAEMFAGQTTGLPRTPVSQIAVGEGGAEPTDADPALAVQRGSPKPIIKVDYGELADPQGIRRIRVQLTAMFGFDDANNPSIPLREAGLLNDGGVLYSRVVFKDVTKTDTFQLTLLWEIVF